MNKNLKHQTAQPAESYQPEPTQEQISTALRLRNLYNSKEWKILTEHIQPELQTLTETAFNSRLPQPARINALEQLTGIRMVLEFPGNYVSQIEELLKADGNSLDDYKE